MSISPPIAPPNAPAAPLPNAAPAHRAAAIRFARAQPQRREVPRDGRGRRRRQIRHVAAPARPTACRAAARARGVPGAVPSRASASRGAECVEQFRGFALISSSAAPGARVTRCEQRLERVGAGGLGGAAVRRGACSAGVARRRPACVVVLFDDAVADELVAVARHGADEARLARVVAERAADGADRPG
jgi:hypothetical protein